MKIKKRIGKITPVQLDDLKKHRKKINGYQSMLKTIPKIQDIIRLFGKLDLKPIVETDRAHLHTWSDVSELNYWGRKIGFTKLNENYNLIEI